MNFRSLLWGTSSYTAEKVASGPWPDSAISWAAEAAMEDESNPPLNIAPQGPWLRRRTFTAARKIDLNSSTYSLIGGPPDLGCGIQIPISR